MNEHDGGVEEPAVPSLRPPRSRALFLAALGLAAAGVLTAIVFIAVGEEGEPIQITGVGQTNQLLGGILQDGAALGSPQAPVTISLFNDLQCPSCAGYHLRTVPPLVEDLVRDGDARLELRHFSIGRQQSTTITAAAAAAAAGQEREWQFAHLAFLNLDRAGSNVSDEFLRAIAGGAGLDVGDWEEDREGPQAVAAIEADAELAQELRLPAMPAAVVDGPGGTRRLVDSPSVEEIEAAAEAVR